MLRAMAATAALLSFFAVGTHAHLSVIRQGAESADTPWEQEHFGAAVVAGDFNGDGYDDLATGAPTENESAVPGDEDGIVIVNYGSATGLTHVDAHVVTIGAPADNKVWFGHALAVGDFDDDGYDDLAVGAPYSDVIFDTDAGEVFIYHGSPSGLTGPVTIFLNQGDAAASVDPGDLFGWSLAAGDFNGDGNDDLAVGAPGENGSTGAVSFFYGIVFVGISTGTAVTVTQLSYSFTNTSSDQFGYALTAKPFRGDDVYDDLAIGAPFFDTIIPTTPDAGRVLVVQGAAAGLSTTTALDIRPELIGETSAIGGNFGYALSGGNIISTSGDCEVAIGEPGYPQSGQADAGRVVLVKAVAAATPRLISQLHVSDEFPEAGDRFGSVLAAGKHPRFDSGSQWDRSSYDVYLNRDALIVGTPLETREAGVGGAIILQQTGVVTVFYPSPIFPSLNTTYSFDDGNGWHELIDEPFAHFGSALCTGNFNQDPDGWKAVAIGSPDANYRIWLDEECPDPDDSCLPATDPTRADAGMVSLIAPWRMPTAMRTRSSAALNCDGDLIFSVRPFDEIRTASTTKAMTLLLTAEAIEASQLDSNQVYMVPNWIPQCRAGSSGEIGFQEQLRVIDIMKMISSVSANDGAYFMADILTGFNGGYPNDCLGRKGVPNATLAHIANMNTRASQIGMSSGTKFLTPAGRDQSYGGNKNRSTAHDMAILSHYAIQNSPLFEKVVGTEEWQIDRTVPFTPPALVKETYRFGWLTALKGWSSRAVGIKSGGTKWGQQCGIFAGRVALPDPEVAAASFGALNRDWCRRKGAEMIELALRHGSCGPPIGLPPPEPEQPLAKLPAVSTELDECQSIFFETAQEDTQEVDVTVEVSNLDANPHSGVLHLIQKCAGVLEPGEAGTFEVIGIDYHEGFVISNPGNATLDLQITASHPALSYSVLLDSTDTDTIPAFAGPVSVPVTLTVENLGRSSAELEVKALGYGMDFTLNSAGQSSRTISWKRTMPVHREYLRCVVCGLDTPGTESTVSLTLGEDGLPTAVANPPRDVPVLPGESVIAFARNHPNPFNPATTIEFRLLVASDVTLEVFDVSGRRVNVLIAGERYPAGTGSARWNGRSARGTEAASGVYYYRLTAGTSVVTGKMTLIK